MLVSVVNYPYLLQRALFLCPEIEGGLKRSGYGSCCCILTLKFPIMEVPFMRVKITLSCTECKQRNYNTMKNKKNNPDRLEMNKYCRFCKKHTLHKETK